ncbi:MAG: DivIVA domain-containing protein [Cellulomonadaceae bacterium]
MSGTFTRLGGTRTGYDPEQVDEFFDHARSVYEGTAPEAMTSTEIHNWSFDLVRGGYATGEVDGALDRLEAAFVAKARADFIAEHGQQAWMAQLAELARTLYGRLTRADGERFAPAERGQHAYDRDDVDALCRRLVAYFDRSEPITSEEIRATTFRGRRGRAGYAEAPVDAFLARAIEVLLGVE